MLPTGSSDQFDNFRMRSDEQIAPELSTLLSSLRKRIRRFVFIDSTLAIIGLLLGSFWIGLLIDHTPVRFGGTEMPWLARFLFLALSVTSLLWLTIKMLVARLLRPLPNPSLALLIERQHPELGGRLTTAVELLAADRPIEDHSRLLLAKVHLQAAKLIRDIDPSRLFKRETLIKKSLVTAPLSIAAIVLFILDPNSFALAAKRLTLLSDAPWPRRADLEMVGIETPVIRASEENSDQTELIKFENQLVRLPIGSSSSLRIRARANDAELPPVCTVFYETDAGSVGQSNMRRVGRVTDDFQYFVLDGPPLTDLNESLTLSVRGLDDRLDNFRIEAVQPPTISDANVAVTFPNYLKVSDTGNPDWSRSYQTGIRVEEGSDVELVIRSTSTLGSVDLAIQGNTSANPASSRSSEIKIAADGLSASLKIEGVQTATTISMVPRDTDRISAQAPYRYLIGVIKDEPPEITLALKGIGNAITANAKLPMTTTISDDYGANRSSVNLVVSKNTDAPPTNDEPESEPIKNGETQDTNPTSLAIPDGSGETALIADLRELMASKQLPQLSPGFEIDLIGETHDRYDLGSEHTTLTQIIRLPVVTPETLLAFLERRELGLRARLEQTLDESRKLRDNLVEFSNPVTATAITKDSGTTENTDPKATIDAKRILQIRRLRIQQAILQSQKTREELTGIATSLNDILLEMQNNRVDSVDRQSRLGAGVRDPIQAAIDGSLQKLQDQLTEIDRSAESADLVADQSKIAVAHCEQLILDLTAILEKMLDLESYNEVLDLVRGLIDDQNDLIEDTKSERKKKVLDLFK